LFSWGVLTDWGMREGVVSKKKPLALSPWRDTKKVHLERGLEKKAEDRVNPPDVL